MTTPAPPSPRTYKELFSDPSNNPIGTNNDELKESLQGSYAQWRVSSNPPDVCSLHQDLLLEFQWPIGGVAVFMEASVDHHPTGVFKILHGIQHFPGRPGKHSLHRDVTFAYLGDVYETDIQSLAFDENLLERTPDINIPGSFQQLNKILSANPDDEMIGPFADSAANTKTMRMRSMMFVPFQVMSALLDLDFTARQAFEKVYPVVLSLGIKQECQPFLGYLMVAMTKPSVTANPLTLANRVGQVGYDVNTDVTS